MEQNEKSGRLPGVRGLRVFFFTPAGEAKTVSDISYDLDYDGVTGIVGESGPGKSQEAYSIMKLLQPPGKAIGGSITFEGRDVLAFSKKGMASLRGSKMTMILQNPMIYLNPVYIVGSQLIGALQAHDKKVSKANAVKRAMEMLELVDINNVTERMKQHPHEFSDGMRQCVMITMDLTCHPKLLIADGPTTAPDVTIRAQTLKLMKEFQKKTHIGIIFTTHNLNVVAGVYDRVSVMYVGKTVKQGPMDDIFYKPGHPHTAGLLRSTPQVDTESYERLTPIEGTPVNILNPPKGYSFVPRCKHAMKICLQKMPPCTELDEGHHSVCWLRVQDQLDRAGQEKPVQDQEVSGRGWEE